MKECDGIKVFTREELMKKTGIAHVASLIEWARDNNIRVVEISNTYHYNVEDVKRAFAGKLLKNTKSHSGR